MATKPLWVYVLEYELQDGTIVDRVGRKVFSKRETALDWLNRNLLMRHDKVAVSLQRVLIEGAAKEDFD